MFYDAAKDSGLEAVTGCEGGWLTVVWPALVQRISGDCENSRLRLRR